MEYPFTWGFDVDIFHSIGCKQSTVQYQNIQGELVPSVTREMSIKLQKKAPAMAVVVVYYMHNSRVLQKKCLFPFLHIHICTCSYR